MESVDRPDKFCLNASSSSVLEDFLWNKEQFSVLSQPPWIWPGVFAYVISIPKIFARVPHPKSCWLQGTGMGCLNLYQSRLCQEAEFLRDINVPAWKCLHPQEQGLDTQGNIQFKESGRRNDGLEAWIPTTLSFYYYYYFKKVS